MKKILVKAIKKDEYLWDSTISCVDNCSWKAGPLLANDMRNNNFLSWERVFIAFIEDEIVGLCTFTKTDCIPSVDFFPFIGFVFVEETYRGNRISQQLIKAALNYAKEIGFNEVFLVSSEKGLYEKYNFQKIDEAVDAYGNIQQIFCSKV